jgi:hypothetical protein
MTMRRTDMQCAEMTLLVTLANPKHVALVSDEVLVNEGEIRLAPVLHAGGNDPSRNLRTHLGRLVEDVEGADHR